MKIFKKLFLVLILVAGIILVLKFMGGHPISPVAVEHPRNVLVLVNREYTLPKDYIPEDLVVPSVRFSPTIRNEQKQMRKEAAKALENLFHEADNNKIKLFCVSGYRSYDYQEQLYNRKVKAVGKKEADKYVASPGQSEHQTGLAMDITNSKGISGSLSESFGDTKEGVWLEENAYKFGFIVRYPEGKEQITGYNYEPWHIRYIGTSPAKEIENKNIVLEEYLPQEKKSFLELAFSNIFDN